MQFLLYALCVFLFPPDFWHNVMQQTPVHVIAAAGSVALIVQAVKKMAPDFINGRWTLVVNLILSIAGVFVTMRPDQFWTQTTLTQVIVVFFTASGTHGVGKGLFGNGAQDAQEQGSSDPQQNGAANQQAGSAPAQKALLMIFGLCAMTLAGCVHPATGVPAAPPPLPAGAADATDANANRVLQTIQGFMTPIVTEIKAGRLVLSPAQRAVLNKLDDYYNKAAIAENDYHHCMTVTAAVVAEGASPMPAPNPATCLTESALAGALASAQSAFSTAQAAIVPSAPQ